MTRSLSSHRTETDNEVSADVEMRSHQRANNATAKEARVIYIVSNEVNRSASCILSIRTVSNTGPNRPQVGAFDTGEAGVRSTQKSLCSCLLPASEGPPASQAVQCAGQRWTSHVDSPGPGLGHGHHAPGLVSPLPPLACDNSTEPKRAGGQGSRAAATWTRTLEVGAENLEAQNKKRRRDRAPSNPYSESRRQQRRGGSPGAG